MTSTGRVSADYSHDEAAFNYRMTNIQAAVGCAQMERLDGFLNRKATIRQRYAEAFSTMEGQSPFPLVPGGSAWFSGIVFGQDAEPALADIVAMLRDRGVEARTFWKPVHLQPPYAEAPTGDLSRTTSVWDRILTLPCSSTLSSADQERVIEAVLDVLGH